MAETDISKIISLIMENPALIEEIKKLAARDTDEEDSSEEIIAEEKSAALTVEEQEPRRPVRRTELLSALKPYISDERKAAIESFITIADILDMMRSK